MIVSSNLVASGIHGRFSANRYGTKLGAYVWVLGFLLFSSPAFASQEFLGTWHAVIANTASVNNRLTLIVSEKDGKLACTFDVTDATSPALARCALSKGALEILTAQDSSVRLVRSGDALQGMLALKSTPNPLRV